MPPRLRNEDIPVDQQEERNTQLQEMLETQAGILARQEERIEQLMNTLENLSTRPPINTIVHENTTDSSKKEDKALRRFKDSVEELLDDADNVEGWLEAAERALTDVSDAVRLVAIRAKLKGPRVAVLLKRNLATWSEFKTELIRILAPEDVRRRLQAEISSMARYKAYSPADAIEQARTDSAFFHRDKAFAVSFDLIIRDAVKAAFPTTQLVGLDPDLNLENTLSELNKRVRAGIQIEGVQGWANQSLAALAITTQQPWRGNFRRRPWSYRRNFRPHFRRYQYNRQPQSSHHQIKAQNIDYGKELGEEESKEREEENKKDFQ